MRYAGTWSLAAAFLVLVLMVGPALGYGAWEDPDAVEPWDVLDELDMTVDDLEDMVQRAISARSAHPAFLDDLEDMISRLRSLSSELAAALPEDTDAWPGRGPAVGDVEFSFDFSQVRSIRSGVINSHDGHASLVFDPEELSLQTATRGQRAALVFPEEEHSGAYFEADWSALTQMTIAMWVYLDDWGPHSRGYARLLTDEDDSDFQVFLHETGDGAYNRYSLVVTWDGYRFTTETESLGLGEWTHIALVHDGQEIQAYINGSRQSLRRTRGSVQPLDFPASQVYHLGNNDDHSRRFYGRIAELTVWNTARSAGEIMSEVRSAR